MEVHLTSYSCYRNGTPVQNLCSPLLAAAVSFPYPGPEKLSLYYGSSPLEGIIY